MSTGTYTYRTAMGVLTNARCQELIQEERQAVSLTDFNILATSLPQHTKVVLLPASLWEIKHNSTL